MSFSAARLLGPWVAEVDAGSLRADALAGLVVAVITLPQAIAYAALAGLPPAWGLYTAIVPCIVAALAGSSRLVQTGPVNAVSLVIATALAPLAVSGSSEYLRLAGVATLLVGAVQALLAVLRLGALANFVSPSVLLGFTSGAAVLIAWHAIDGSVDGRGIEGALERPQEVLLMAGTLLAAVLLRLAWKRGPFLLLALLAAGFAAWALVRWRGVPFEFLGAVPVPWPVWQPPVPEPGDFKRLAGIALALTVVALGQDMAIAKLIAARTGRPLDPNRECLGQGLSNLAGAFFSCFVACGSLNRSLPAVEAGARTPLAAVFSAVFVLVVAWAAAPLTAWMPLAAIGGLLLWVAFALIDSREWKRLLAVDRTEAAIAATTFAATLLVPLHEAVLGGVGLSLVAYLYRSSRPALRTMGFAPGSRGDAARRMQVMDGTAHPECPQLKLLRMEGSIWFGAVAHVADRLHALRSAGAPQRHLLVMAKSMNFIDDAGAALWEHELQRRREAGGDLYFHQPRPEVQATWRRTGFLQRLGEDHVFGDKRSAIAAIVPRLDPAVCERCTLRVFEECARQPGNDRTPGL